MAVTGVIRQIKKMRSLFPFPLWVFQFPLSRLPFDSFPLQAASEQGFSTKGNKVGYMWANTLRRDMALKAAYDAVIPAAGQTKRSAQEQFRQQWATREFQEPVGGMF